MSFVRLRTSVLTGFMKLIPWLPQGLQQSGWPTGSLARTLPRCGIGSIEIDSSHLRQFGYAGFLRDS